jgi:hypothetical protein
MREQLQEIFSTVSRNKLRTFLTGFSVAWGIFMLIVLLGSGNGLRNAMQDNFSGRAINSMFIYSGQTSVPYKGFQSGRHIQINQRDMEILKTEFSDRIDKITASVWHNDAHISYGGEFTSATLYGVLPQTQPIDGIQIVEGGQPCVDGRLQLRAGDQRQQLLSHLLDVGTALLSSQHHAQTVLGLILEQGTVEGRATALLVLGIGQGRECTGPESSPRR